MNSTNILNVMKKIDRARQQSVNARERINRRQEYAKMLFIAYCQDMGINITKEDWQDGNINGMIRLVMTAREYEVGKVDDIWPKGMSALARAYLAAKDPNQAFTDKDILRYLKEETGLKFSVLRNEMFDFTRLGAGIMIGGLQKIRDVKALNCEEVERIPTGIRQLDDILGTGKSIINGKEVLIPGIPKGLTLICGDAGKGKSTLTSMIASEALKAGHRICWYSGEEPDGRVKETLYRQLADPNDIDSSGGGKYPKYHLLPEAESNLDAKYGDRIFMVNTEEASQNAWEDFQFHILYALEAGVDLLIVDNLMTISDLIRQSSAAAQQKLDEYGCQARAAQWLAAIAKEFDVWVLMVCHYKKGSSKESGVSLEEMSNQVSGSSVPKNLATLILNYRSAVGSRIYEKMSADKQKGIDDDYRVIYVSKNRLGGKLTQDGILTKFDPQTLRIKSCWDD